MNNRIALSSLNLQNFATFQNQQVNFLESFNAIVGETGSGKSLILDGLQLIFGARADKSLIRKGSSFATIEAMFITSDKSVKDYFDKLGHPYEEDEISIKRVIYDTGRTRSFLNHQSCPLSLLSNFARDFIDLVGQFENQKLLSEDYQLKLLDSFAKIAPERESYTKSYNEYLHLLNRLKEMQQKKDERLQRQDFVEYQLKEISSLSPSIEDENNLSVEKENLLSKEQKREVINKALITLSNAESGSITSSLKNIISLLEREGNAISKLDLDGLHSAYQALEEVSFNLSKDLDDDLNNTRLNEIVDRLDLYQKLKRKFGGTIETLVYAQKDFQQEYDALCTLDGDISTLSIEVSNFKHELEMQATKLHQVRINKAKILSTKLTDGIRLLKMEGATALFKISQKEELDSSGFSSISFIAETNPGEGYNSVKKVASGGELSRILLTLRQVVASSESISVFLFDEIDAGIGGETAVCTGKALKKVSLNSQVIAITHLPQIANHADKLINVTKIVDNNNDSQIRTVSSISEHTGTDKDKHITKMSQLN